MDALKIGDQLFTARAASGTTARTSRVSLFVRLRLVRSGVESEEVGVLTTGTVCSRLGERIYIRRQPRRQAAPGTPPQDDFVSIGTVVLTRVGTRRDVAVIWISNDQLLLDLNVVSVSPGEEEPLDVWSTSDASAPKVGDSVFLVHDQKLLKGVVSETSGSGRSGGSRRYVGKLACRIDGLTASVGFTGELLVARNRLSESLVPVGTLWGGNWPELLFTPMPYHFDIAAVLSSAGRDERLVAFYQPRVSGDGAASNSSSWPETSPTSERGAEPSDEELLDPDGMDIVQQLDFLLAMLAFNTPPNDV